MKRFYALLSLLAIVSTADPVLARSIWLPPAETSEIRLEALHPRFQYTDFTTFSMLWTLSIDTEVAPGRFVVFEIPYARFDHENADQATSTIGNPYLGWYGLERNSRWHGEFGLRFPMVSDSETATDIAFLTDRVDSPEAWIPNVLSARAEACYTSQEERSIGAKLGFGPILWIDAGEALEDEFEAWIHAHGQVLFVADRMIVGVGLSARYLITARDGTGFYDRTMQEYSIFASRNTGTWRPAVRMRFPWDTVLDAYADPSLSVSLGRTF